MKFGLRYCNTGRFVDPARELSVVMLSNTAVAGMIGPFPDAVRDAIYASI